VPDPAEGALEEQVTALGAAVEGGFGRKVELSVHRRLVQLELLW
jgi:hypothetical protein